MNTPTNESIDQQIRVALRWHDLSFQELCATIVRGYGQPTTLRSAHKTAEAYHAAIKTYEAGWRQLDRRLQVLKRLNLVRFDRTIRKWATISPDAGA